MIRYTIIIIIIISMLIMFLHRRYVNAQLEFIIPIIKNEKGVLHTGESTNAISKLIKMGFSVNKDNNTHKTLIVNDSTYDIYKLPGNIKNIIVIGDNNSIMDKYEPNKILDIILVPKITYYKINNKKK